MFIFTVQIDKQYLPTVCNPGSRPNTAQISSSPAHLCFITLNWISGSENGCMDGCSHSFLGMKVYNTLEMSDYSFKTAHSWKLLQVTRCASMQDALLLLAFKRRDVYHFIVIYAQHSHVLDYNVLVRHQAVDAIVPSLPPVVGRSLIQQQGGALLERQLSGRAPDVVELGNGFNRLALCQHKGD